MTNVKKLLILTTMMIVVPVITDNTAICSMLVGNETKNVDWTEKLKAISDINLRTLPFDYQNAIADQMDINIELEQKNNIDVNEQGYAIEVKHWGKDSKFVGSIDNLKRLCIAVVSHRDDLQYFDDVIEGWGQAICDGVSQYEKFFSKKLNETEIGKKILGNINGLIILISLIKRVKDDKYNQNLIESYNDESRNGQIKNTLDELFYESYQVLCKKISAGIKQDCWLLNQSESEFKQYLQHDWMCYLNNLSVLYSQKVTYISIDKEGRVEQNKKKNYPKMIIASKSSVIQTGDEKRVSECRKLARELYVLYCKILSIPTPNWNWNKKDLIEVWRNRFSRWRDKYLNKEREKSWEMEFFSGLIGICQVLGLRLEADSYEEQYANVIPTYAVNYPEFYRMAIALMSVINVNDKFGPLVNTQELFDIVDEVIGKLGTEAKTIDNRKRIMLNIFDFVKTVMYDWNDCEGIEINDVKKLILKVVETLKIVANKNNIQENQSNNCKTVPVNWNKETTALLMMKDEFEYFASAEYLLEKLESSYCPTGDNRAERKKIYESNYVGLRNNVIENVMGSEHPPFDASSISNVKIDDWVNYRKYRKNHRLISVAMTVISWAFAASTSKQNCQMPMNENEIHKNVRVYEMMCKLFARDEKYDVGSEIFPVLVRFFCPKNESNNSRISKNNTDIEMISLLNTHNFINLVNQLVSKIKTLFEEEKFAKLLQENSTYGDVFNKIYNFEKNKQFINRYDIYTLTALSVIHLFIVSSCSMDSSTGGMSGNFEHCVQSLSKTIKTLDNSQSTEKSSDDQYKCMTNDILIKCHFIFSSNIIKYVKKIASNLK